jgi:hypothetical protein
MITVLAGEYPVLIFKFIEHSASLKTNSEKVAWNWQWEPPIKPLNIIDRYLSPHLMLYFCEVEFH